MNKKRVIRRFLFWLGVAVVLAVLDAQAPKNFGKVARDNLANSKSIQNLQG